MSVHQTSRNQATITIRNGAFRIDSDGTASVLDKKNRVVLELTDEGTAPDGTRVSLSYTKIGGRLLVSWTMTAGTPGMISSLSWQSDLGCWLAMAGLALGTVGIIAATAGTAAAFGLAGASYVISVGGVITGCY